MALKSNRRGSFFTGFVYAWNGLTHAIKHERNLKFHLFSAVVVILLSFFLQISYYKWLIVLLVIGIVISLELVNSAVERIVDLVTEEYHPMAKIAKDTAAAAVFSFSMIAAIIGVCIFYQPILEFVRGYLN